MANFPVDPRPFVPPRFTLMVREVVREPRRIRCFLAPTLQRENEDLAIALTELAVSKTNFGPFARELQRFLLDLGIRLPEIQQYPIGEAFVRFDSAMQREGFLIGGPREFSGYQLRFIRHDEGINFKDLALDRAVWLMLLYFPPDARRRVALVEKSIAGFTQLLMVHSSSSESRLVIKALVNKYSDIPDSVTVSTGSGPLARSWTVPVFLLSASDIVLGGDEEPILVDGLTHPMPQPAPEWMGPHGVHGFANWVDEGASVNGGNVQQPGGVQAQGDQVDGRSDEVTEEIETQAFGSADPTPLQVLPPALGTVTMLPLKVNLSSISFSIPCSIPFGLGSNLSSLMIDLDIMVPDNISDCYSLRFLATICVDQENHDGPVFGPAPPLVPYSDDTSDDEDDLKEIDGPIPKATPKKRRAKMMREPLEDDFCRRSKRLNPDTDGFKREESQAAAENFPTIYSGAAAGTSAPPPHLTMPVVEGIAVIVHLNAFKRSSKCV
ncbi:unnamed protein product [Urochloa humidicola]